MQKQAVIVVTHPNVKDQTITERDYLHPQCSIDVGHLSSGELRDVRAGIVIEKTRRLFYYSGERVAGLLGYRGEQINVDIAHSYSALLKEDAPDAECAECSRSVLGPRAGQSTAQASNYYKVGKGDIR